ncbi:metalloregulator ArsR/SmtB family transcription factor [Aeromicrobium sp. Leaf350]|uniref:helix-turn-helix transcriptional regulator n=1 Tax=Aeromicrobium sp. Leaf350 TaxID=2876565 RepID=UPI001E4FCBAA|nr:metalloregulator ArsR/SmtB family transcription factor [Aeromicrobium sp. Leaf350]
MSHDDSPTRARVAEAILRGGPSTAAALARELDLTPAAIRRHLDHLVGEGMLEPREQRILGQRGRGRPAKVFALTDAGRGQFAHAYDEIAVDALAFVRDTMGDDAVKRFASHRLDDLRARLAVRLADLEPSARPAALADALSAEGFAASTSNTPAGTQMCQHHCPVAHVAEQFPQLCEAEAEMFAGLLGTHVQRLATIAHGDGVCTTHLPDPATPTHSTSSPHAEKVTS